MKRKKLLALLLASAMAMCAAGCGNDSSEQGGSSNSDTSQSLNGSQAEEEADNLESVESAGGEAQVKDLGTLTIINMGSKPESFDMDTDYYPILDSLTEKWGFKARITYVSWGEEQTTLQTKVAGGDYHAVSIGPWSNYTQLAQAGYFKDLTPFLDEVPDLCAAYGGKEELLKLSIDGRGLCYIPQRAGSNNAHGFWYRTDLCEEMDVEPITDVESLNAYLYAAKEKFGRPMIYSPSVVWYLEGMYDDLSGIGTGVGMITSLQSDPYTPVLTYDLDGYKKAMEQAVQWYNDGIVSPDVMNSNALPDVGNELMAGTLPCHYANHLASGKVNFIPQAMAQLNAVNGQEDTEAANPNGIEFGFMPYLTETAKIYEANNGNTTGWAINAKCTDEETIALLKFAEAAHADVDFFDSYQYGKQGTNYDSFIDENGGRYISYGDLDAGNRMYRKLATGLTDEVLMRTEKMKYAELEQFFIDQEAALSERVVANPLNGFVFDPTNVENQIMAVGEASSNFASYEAGIIGNKTVDEAIEEMKEAAYDNGLQDILDEVSRQLQEYKEKNGL